MSSTHHREFTGACRCGKGTFNVDFCEVDHGYPVANPEWYEASIDCPACAKEFVIERRGPGFFLVARSDVQEKEALAANARAQLDAVRGDAEVLPVIERFIRAVDDQPSVAATYRFLSPHGFTRGTLPTFRKHWRGAAHLIAKPSARELRAVFDAVGADKTRLEALLAPVEEMEAQARVAPPTVGPVIYIPRVKGGLRLDRQGMHEPSHCYSTGTNIML